ncbi:glycosyltransferase [Bradyrhizobium sp. UFLA05-112]
MASNNRTNIVWLTKTDPRSKFGGELIYSEGLIRALAPISGQVHVLFYASEEEAWNDTAARYGSNVFWHPIKYSAPSLLGSLLSQLPYHAYRYDTRPYLDKALQTLSEVQPSAVIIDSLAMGWICRPLRASIGSLVKTVYLAHNHEGTVRLSAARGFEGNSLKRVGLIYDAVKAQLLEKRLGRSVSVISSITDHDARLFKKDFGDERRVIVVPPGYEPVPESLPPHSLSRTICIVGSFEWHAKQTNLLRFLEASHTILRQKDVKVRVIGSMPTTFRAKLNAAFPEWEVTGKVKSISDHAQDCAMGLIVEELGGGFKLKALDYVFLGLPIVALAGSMVGMPLVANKDYFEGKTLGEIIDLITTYIDDVEHLREVRESAYKKAKQVFSWQNSAHALATC